MKIIFLVKYTLLVCSVLSLCAGCSQDKESRLIEKARSSGFYNDYQQYLVRFPDGVYVDEACSVVLSYYDSLFRTTNAYEGTDSKQWVLRRLSTVKKANEGTETGERFSALLESLVSFERNVALSKDNYSCWEAFLLVTPEEFHAIAERHIDSLNRTLFGNEALGWETARKANTLDYYFKYLELYPEGEHSNLAKKKTIDLRVGNWSMDKYDDYPADWNRGIPSGDSWIDITNRTDSEIELLFSGKKSYSIIVPGHGITTIKVENGNYMMRMFSKEQSVYDIFSKKATFTGGTYSFECSFTNRDLERIKKLTNSNSY